ncbi:MULTISPECIES: hypothetical protein [Kocuria]|jgi:hypothetical protein|uniref:hypothetical protein n=1 Tax=Kocuria TaxID=57493 RepID=UPI00203DE6C5|nr:MULTISPECIES: hypothetical protein [Kocuria]MCM3687397.1 hypothetical protein [Kocuria rosea]
MCAELLLDPGFYVRPLPGTGPSGHLATVCSTLVFEAFEDALHHLDQLSMHLEPEHAVVGIEPRPVRAHVPGTVSPNRPIGHRLVSRDAADPAAIARQVAALKAAVACLGMTGVDTLDPLTP